MKNFFITIILITASLLFCNEKTAYSEDTVNPNATEVRYNGKDDDILAELPPDPGEEGKLTLLGIDSDGDGVRDDIQRYIYFTYPNDELLRLGLTYYAKGFQDVLADADDSEASYAHSIEMSRHGECIWYINGRGFADTRLKDREAVNICRALRAEILNTHDRSVAYITHSDNLGGRVIRSAPMNEWKNSCAFDVDAVGGGQ
jgi:hypothetical protein